MKKPDILIFAEDPGAANYLNDLPNALAAHGYTSISIVHGKAIKFFKEQGNDFVLASSFNSAEEIFQKYSPRLVLLGTSASKESMGLSITIESRKNGIPSIGAIDSFINAEYRYSGGTSDPLVFAPDWLVVPDVWTSDEFIRIGYPKKQVIICGHPLYDFVRKRSKVLKKVGYEKLRKRFFPKSAMEKVILIVAPDAEYPDRIDEWRTNMIIRGDDYTLHGRGNSIKRTDIVLDELFDALSMLQHRPYLVLRPHPKNDPKDFEVYLKDFDQICQNEPLHDLIYASDCVVGMTSTILHEALLLGRNILSIIPRELERNWLPFTRLGVAKCAATREELKLLLPKVLKECKRPVNNLDAIFEFGAVSNIIFIIDKLLH